MTVAALDSATPPTLGDAQCAKAHGYGAWLGYLPPSSGWHSAVWPTSTFAAVRQAGLETAGVVFGPDATHAVAAARAAGVGLVIVDVEANDPGHYAPSWGDAVRAAGLRAGVYGLRRTIDAFADHFDVMWYAAEQWDGQPLHGAQHGYDMTVCGVAVDVSTFGDAVFAAPAPPPPPTPPSPPPLEDDMKLIKTPSGRISILGAEGRRGLGQPEVDAYIRANAVPAQPEAVTEADYDAIRVMPGATP